MTETEHFYKNPKDGKLYKLVRHERGIKEKGADCYRRVWKLLNEADNLRRAKETKNLAIDAPIADGAGIAAIVLLPTLSSLDKRDIYIGRKKIAYLNPDAELGYYDIAGAVPNITIRVSGEWFRVYFSTIKEEEKKKMLEICRVDDSAVHFENDPDIVFIKAPYPLIGDFLNTAAWQHDEKIQEWIERAGYKRVPYIDILASGNSHPFIFAADTEKRVFIMLSITDKPIGWRPFDRDEMKALKTLAIILNRL